MKQNKLTMPRSISIFFLFLLIISSQFACASININVNIRPSARILEQNTRSAVVYATGDSRYEAQTDADREAREIFPSYVAENRECSQEYIYVMRKAWSMIFVPGSGISRKYLKAGRTYWACVLEIRKS